MTTNTCLRDDRFVYIVAAKRTPIGSIGGSLSSLDSTQLAASAMKGCIDQINLDPNAIEAVVAGQAIQGDTGQSTAKQALIEAGIPPTCRDTMVKEVCASGLQAVVHCALHINFYNGNCSLAVGVESMSRAPRIVPRICPVYGDLTLADSITKDGLTDRMNNCQMGHLAEKTAKQLNITRQDQDAFAIESYTRARRATESGLMSREINPVTIAQRGNKPPVVVSEDEEYKKLDIAKVATLKPCFDTTGTGTITGANASSLGDGAAACILMSAEAASRHNATPLARIISFGVDACDPRDFSISPVQACKIALVNANLTKEQISLWEINEAFSLVAVANTKLLDLDPAKVNINGGGVSIGHPLGMSGVRILNSLVYNLQSGQYGCAGICRGGGGATAMIIQKL